jgi:hypothetical protein
LENDNTTKNNRKTKRRVSYIEDEEEEPVAQVKEVKKVKKEKE